MPLPWISERHLLEPDAVVPGRAGNMEVTIHDRRSVEATMPVGGLRGAAPLRELGMKQDLGGGIDQGKVIDQSQAEYPARRLLDALRCAPPWRDTTPRESA